MKIPFYVNPITKLNDNEVFVFGSNKKGFHGAGAAGYASFGHGDWRKENYDKWEPYTKGMWNVKGISKGMQVGKFGKSYAIPTIEYPGKKRSIPLDDIRKSIIGFYKFAFDNHHMIFYVAQEGKMGLNGYSPEEMGSIWSVPSETARSKLMNVVFNKNFIPYLKY